MSLVGPHAALQPARFSCRDSGQGPPSHHQLPSGFTRWSPHESAFPACIVFLALSLSLRPLSFVHKQIPCVLFFIWSRRNQHPAHTQLPTTCCVNSFFFQLFLELVGDESNEYLIVSSGLNARSSSACSSPRCQNYPGRGTTCFDSSIAHTVEYQSDANEHTQHLKRWDEKKNTWWIGLFLQGAMRERVTLVAVRVSAIVIARASEVILSVFSTCF